jgi:hypothetical protein
MVKQQLLQPHEHHLLLCFIRQCSCRRHGRQQMRLHSHPRYHHTHQEQLHHQLPLPLLLQHHLGFLVAASG